MKMRSERNQYLLLTVYHTTAHYTAQLYWPFAITTSGFYFRNWKVFWLNENASCHSENASFTRRFSTCPVGRALWEESLVLSKIHSSIRADEWNFCPLTSIKYTANNFSRRQFQMYFAGPSMGNSADADQMSPDGALHLGLHC